MGIPKLESCCFIFSLKNGNLIIGTLNAVCSLLLTIGIFSVVSGFQSSKSEIAESDDLSDKKLYSTVNPMAILLGIIFLAKFLFDAFFVYGVKKEIPGIIRSYFVVWTVLFVLSLFISLLNSENWNILREIAYNSLNIYAILLCRSYYIELTTPEEI